MRQVPESLRELTRDRSQIILIQMREVREPVPEEDWLRGHALVTDQRKLGSAEIVNSARSTATHPKRIEPGIQQSLCFLSWIPGFQICLDRLLPELPSFRFVFNLR
jgi:hypothetical protein